jgi:Transposase DDE domain group 1
VKGSRVPMLVLDPGRESLVSSAGGVLLRRTLEVCGLGRSLSVALSPWRSSRAAHDPGKVLLDVATAVALGGDCLADVAVVRAQPEVFGSGTSDPAVSRLVAALAGDVDAAVAAVRSARAAARERVWGRRRPVAGEPGGQVTIDMDAAVAAVRSARAAAREWVWGRRRPVAGVPGGQVTIDMDATLVTVHSEKELAAPTFKRGFGFHSLFAFVDHGGDGSGETVAGLLRTGSAGANCAADHITVLDAALAQLPERERENVVVRTDAGGGVKDFLHHITDLGSEYSVGSTGCRPLSKRSIRYPGRLGGPRSTPTATPARAPRSPSSPPTSPPPGAGGRPGCGSSPAANVPIPERSCGSPTTRDGESPASPPTPAAPAGHWLRSRSATANAPAPRTASAP